MTYRIEVLCKVYSIKDGDQRVWKPVRPSGTDRPYEGSTLREAEAMRGLFYDADPSAARVVEVIS